jgi:hypothetical protein
VPRLQLRIAVTSAAVLWLVRWCGADLVRRLLPLFADVVTTLDPTFRLLSLDLDGRDLFASVRLRADLAHAIHVNGYTVVPFGTTQGSAGWYQVNLHALAVLQGAVVLLIAVLAWPAQRPAELGLRLLLSVPVLFVLLMIDAPLQLLGVLQWVAVGYLDPQRAPLLLIWDRFLQGGGNSALALGAAICIIVLAAQRTGRAQPLIPTVAGVPS